MTYVNGTYSNIDASEGLGSTVNTVLKGTGQIIAGTVDQALAPGNGLTTLLAISLVVAAAIFVIYKLGEGKQAVEKIL